ncbi:MAG: hypothetical protein KAR19_18950 [Bacteroidales bacterium]|nr:hypothetical protein [Bacteroidales bacterium]
MSKPLLIVLANENPDDHSLWVKACKRKKNAIDYKVVNLSQADWFERIKENINAAYFLCKPPCITSSFKHLYDERLTILTESLHLPVYPSLQECLIYENKRFLSYWLKANRIPHPQTNVFYFKKETLEFIEQHEFPLVAKVNIGASGSGITFLHSKKEACNYIEDAFGRKGAKRRSGPNLEKGNFFRRGMHYVLHPADIGKKIRLYQTVKLDIQKGFVIFQEFIFHNYEWRVIRVGDSFFAHKKLRKKEKTSGSLLKGYEDPPLELLDYVRDITDKHHFYSQAVDIFESDRGYLVNEMQCIFGQSDPFQMLVNGKPGRYRYNKNKWQYEEGDFTSNQCYDLRLEFILSKVS